MLFRRKIERACAYCARAARIDDDTVACRRKGPVPAEGSCRRFKYDPLKRSPERPHAGLPVDDEADYSL